MGAVAELEVGEGQELTVLAEEHCLLVKSTRAGRAGSPWQDQDKNNLFSKDFDAIK